MVVKPKGELKMRAFTGYKTVKELIEAPECINVQYMCNEPPFDGNHLLKTCCALSNSGGGQVVFGITNTMPREVVKTDAYTKSDITRSDIHEYLNVVVCEELFECEDKKLVWVINIPPRHIQTTTKLDGISWWYENGKIVQMPEQLLYNIYVEEFDYDFSSVVCTGASIDDLDDVAIEYFRRKWISHTKNNKLETLTKTELLHECGVLTKKGLTYASLILFGTESAILKYLPCAQTLFEFRVKEEMESPGRSVNFSGGFFCYFDKLWDTINYCTYKDYYLKKATMIPVNTFNEKVIREAILNAVAHREYELQDKIYIRQCVTKFSIENPGILPDSVTIDNIRKRQIPRNSLVSKIFLLCGLTQIGQGMKYMYKYAMREAKSLPDITVLSSYIVRVVLDCNIIANRMLATMQELSEEIFQQITTRDYYFLSRIFTHTGFRHMNWEDVKHIAELKILENEHIHLPSPDDEPDL
jgi:ATP-dependent DNA helicase RecG